MNGDFGGRTEALSDPCPSILAFGSEVLRAIPARTTYARIDVVSTSRGPVLMEVEINEPALGLHLCPGSASRFADALEPHDPIAGVGSRMTQGYAEVNVER